MAVDVWDVNRPREHVVQAGSLCQGGLRAWHLQAVPDTVMDRSWETHSEHRRDWTILLHQSGDRVLVKSVSTVLHKSIGSRQMVRKEEKEKGKEEEEKNSKNSSFLSA